MEPVLFRFGKKEEEKNQIRKVLQERKKKDNSTVKKFLRVLYESRLKDTDIVLFLEKLYKTCVCMCVCVYI